MLGLTVFLAAAQVYLTQRGPVETDPPIVQKATDITARHPIGGLVLVGALFVVAGILNSVPALIRYLHERKSPRVRDEFPEDVESDSSPAPPPPPTPAEHNSNWLGRMITEDLDRLQQRVIAVRWEPRRAFDKTDPYIDFVVTFVNATVFAFNKPEKIQGKAKFGNHPLSSAPQLETAFPLTSRERATMVIRQFVSPSMAQHMQAAISAPNHSAMLDFSEVKIFLNGHCDGIANTNFDWMGPNEVSLKESLRSKEWTRLENPKP